MQTHKLGLLLNNPSQIYDRIRHKVECWSDRSTDRSKIAEIVPSLAIGGKVANMFPGTPRMENSAAIRQWIADKEVSNLSPFGAVHNGTESLGELCYLVCRYLRPRLVVETGVAGGVTSAYILQALHDNGEGRLQSIDLPPLASGGEKFVGCFVPARLRYRWQLHIGAAKRILPQLLHSAEELDLFVHDSLHTYSHMKWEFETVLPKLQSGGLIISDDIQGNTAFEEIARHPRVSSWFVAEQSGKDAFCGALRIR